MSDEPDTSVTSPATPVLVSAGDQSVTSPATTPATGRRPSPVTTLGRRTLRRRCPTCQRFFRWNSLSRHRRRMHPETPIPSLEGPNVHVAVRDRLSFSPMRCGSCRQAIPTGTPLATLVRPPSRRGPWTHLVCPAGGAGGDQPPQTPTEKEPHTPHPTTLPRVGGFPSPAPAPTSPATVGDVLLSPAQILELGVARVESGARSVTIHLVEGSTGGAVVNRLFGGELRPCQTCRELGRSSVMPESALQQHDFSEHADLWMRGRRLAEAEAVKTRRGDPRRMALPAPRSAP